LSAGFPIIFGFTVYSSFESDAVATTGMVPMPMPNEEVEGGHCTVICGHNDAVRLYTVRNSWGVGWGDQGYFYMPYEYVEDPDLASDFAVIQVVT
jgi:C1A family cysteine protease